MLPSRRVQLEPRAARLWLTAFIIRHTLGLALFVGLIPASFAFKAPAIGYLFLVLTPVYGAFAFISARKMVLQYRRLMQQRGR